MKNKTLIFGGIVLAVVLIAAVAFFFGNGGEKPVEKVADKDLQIEKCIQNLTSFYQNAEFENDTLLLGYKEEFREQIISLVEKKGLVVEKQPLSTRPYLLLSVKEGEVLKQICLLSNDEEMKDVLRYVEPNFIGHLATL